ncbi:MAG: oxygen-independent coproporphyrinogen-3 oxidase [Planctomycetota bacterium]|jgi:oxygen-independent coproporphyrinogen-3 oxidase
MIDRRSAIEKTAGLYIHVPFCSFVCPYCDFAVERAVTGEVEQFVEILLQEIDRVRDFDFLIETVYFGGGTPSLLPLVDLSRILAAIERRFEMKSDWRLHLEMNPEDVRADTLRGYHDLNVKFLSLGIQSFIDADLKFLGRRHSADEARRGLELAANAKFDTLSVDLMFGLPSQDIELWVEQLDYVGSSNIDHVSCYQLNVKPGTLFEKRIALGRFSELGDQSQGDFFQVTHERLDNHGLSAYEVSNFARHSRSESAHNKKYWDHSPYLGLGPSAHSFAGSRRFWNHKKTVDWSKSVLASGHGVEGDELLEPADLALEEVMLGLRQPKGIDLVQLKEQYGIDLLHSAEEVVDKLVRDQLVTMTDRCLCPTRSGLAVADAIAADLGASF